MDNSSMIGSCFVLIWHLFISSAPMPYLIGLHSSVMKVSEAVAEIEETVYLHLEWAF